MLVCHCLAVNDRAVARAVAEGATTVDDLTARCGAGGRCGGCRPALAELLAELLAEAEVDLRRRSVAAA